MVKKKRVVYMTEKESESPNVKKIEIFCSSTLITIRKNSRCSNTSMLSTISQEIRGECHVHSSCQVTGSAHYLGVRALEVSKIEMPFDINRYKNSN